MRTFTELFGLAIFAALALGRITPAVADQIVVDKIYHPYVQPLEQELEFRTAVENNNGVTPGSRDIFRLGYGQSFNDRWFGEFYVIGDNNDARGFDIRAFELEALWQLTQQGEYAADWGLLFEFDKAYDKEVTEFSTALLVEREWGRWSTTGNLYGTYEFGADTHSNFKSKLNLQARYRYSAYFEPAIEFYKGENITGIGPVALGRHALGNGRNMSWEAGLIFGLNHATADRTVRVLFEYEF